MSSTVSRRRFVLAATLSVVSLVLVWELFIVQAAGPIRLGYDTRAYWGFPRGSVYPEGGAPMGYGAYRYSPVFVPLMTLFTQVPWPLFLGSWMAATVAIYVFMAGPWSLPLLVFVPIVIEIGMGNIHLLLALAVVLGFRWPAAWSFVLLTKVTPGIGLLWFAVRREWRALALALGATAVIAGVSWVLSPDLWRQWLTMLSTTTEAPGANLIGVPLSVRLVIAAVLVTWGARTDRRWTVIVAATISLPVVWNHGLAMLVGIVALRRGLPDSIAASTGWMRSWVRPVRSGWRRPLGTADWPTVSEP